MFTIGLCHTFPVSVVVALERIWKLVALRNSQHLDAVGTRFVSVTVIGRHEKTVALAQDARAQLQLATEDVIDTVGIV